MYGQFKKKTGEEKGASKNHFLKNHDLRSRSSKLCYGFFSCTLWLQRNYENILISIFDKEEVKRLLNVVFRETVRIPDIFYSS